MIDAAVQKFKEGEQEAKRIWKEEILKGSQTGTDSIAGVISRPWSY